MAITRRAGAYRELAAQLRELARRCLIPRTKFEAVQLAIKFETRAERLELVAGERRADADAPGGLPADDFRAKVFRDGEHTEVWRVEKLEDDGDSSLVTIFSGGDARRRAIRYAEREYGELDDFIARLTAASDQAKPRRG